ncbi:MAG: hypothetical protein HY073_04855 [Deltaproteobacteria bacterium]|nr:hypothetical protein [Deltaproteobacteria bacterium]
MSQFDSVFAELRRLQSRLKVSANRLWSLRSQISSAYFNEHQESDFLPRRLIQLKIQEQIKFDQCLSQLNFVISTRLDSAFIVFSSEEDVKTVAEIRRTIRYIRNAFAGELHLGGAFAQLSLPASSLS